MSISAVVLGASGYVGGEMLRLIAVHPDLHFVAAVSESKNGETIAKTFANLSPAYGEQRFVGYDGWLDDLEEGSDLALFSAAPHGASAGLIATALKNTANKNVTAHVVDASADFRYSNQIDYETVYGNQHGAPDLLDAFQSGVPEHVANVQARHVGHPGCFATAVLLASVPLIDSGLTGDDLFVTGITGSTGSGRSPQPGTHHPERHSNLYAYKPLAHRHAPEIEVLIGSATGKRATVNFVPHSGPFARGIHVTVQAKTTSGVTTAQLQEVFAQAYKDAPFVDVVSGTPRLKDVVASNMCRIGVAGADDSIVVMCVIDNLIKGAAGGAMQWMNRLWGLPETTGLMSAAPGWT